MGKKCKEDLHNLNPPKLYPRSAYKLWNRNSMDRDETISNERKKIYGINDNHINEIKENKDIGEYLTFEDMLQDMYPVQYPSKYYELYERSYEVILGKEKQFKFI